MNKHRKYSMIIYTKTNGFFVDTDRISPNSVNLESLHWAILRKLFCKRNFAREALECALNGSVGLPPESPDWCYFNELLKRSAHTSRIVDEIAEKDRENAKIVIVKWIT